jgi:predicted  nucleic acid-binding Zn ribbon protein
MFSLPKRTFSHLTTSTYLACAHKANGNSATDNLERVCCIDCLEPWALKRALQTSIFRFIRSKIPRQQV